MIHNIRERFNHEFSIEKYQNILKEFEEEFKIDIAFRISETPIFIDKSLSNKVFTVCEAIINQLKNINFKEIEQKFLPDKYKTPSPIPHSHFLAIDFGLCENKKGKIEPLLIELQAFPSLYAYQIELGKKIIKHYPFIKDQFNSYLSNLNEKEYIIKLKKLLLGKYSPENVVLLEIYPHKQKTYIDFLATEKYFGIQPLCLTKVIKEGKKLFYINKKGKKTLIKRIYNRIIFDELYQFKDLQTEFNFSDEVEVEWVTHPDWFFTISKSILPLLTHKYIPKSYYLNDFPETEKLENYVLKPLFSFAGKGVVLHPTTKILSEITDKENYILQRKVNYSKLIPSPTGEKSKVELRILYSWDENEDEPKPIINLARMSKGELINVNYNTQDNWIGGTIAFFEK